MATRKIRVSGRVQGVGFRASLQEEAQKLGVSGWVRNRSDGTVEALLQGTPQGVEALVAWARRGPPGSRVAGLTDSAAEHEATHGSFELRPTC